jgi:hypothetical protein
VARNNLTWIKGDITGDIYFDIFHLDSKDVQYLRLYLMIKGVVRSVAVKGLRVCVYGPLAELVYGHVRKGSRLGVIGHIQQRTTREGKMVFEIVAEEVEFLRNIEWEAGCDVGSKCIIWVKGNRDSEVLFWLMDGLRADTGRRYWISEKAIEVKTCDMEGRYETFNDRSQNRFSDDPQFLDNRRGAYTMVGKLVRSEIAQQLLSDLVWKLHNRVKPSSLIYVIQLVESRKAHQILRSAERAPTLSAGR